MKKIIVGLGLAAVLALSGCGAGDPTLANNSDPSKGYDVTANADYAGVFTYNVHLPDGRTVLCLVESAHGTMSCDWDHVK